MCSRLNRTCIWANYEARLVESRTPNIGKLRGYHFFLFFGEKKIFAEKKEEKNAILLVFQY